MPIQLFDKSQVSATRMTKDGYLVAEARAARTGVYEYRGSELKRPDLDAVMVYRPPEEVFADDSLASFTSLPITVDHPPEMVNAKNWKKYARGYTGEEVAKDDIYVRVPLILKDARAIEAVQAGKNELSFGYTCDVEFTSGLTPDGQKYDAIQRNPRGNHLAIVSAGRAGRDCKIGDADDDYEEGLEMPGDVRTKMVTVDGFSVETTEAGAQAIATLGQRVADRTAENLQLQAVHKAALEARDVELADLRKQVSEKDKELGTKDAELKLMKDAATDSTRLDQLVAERADVVTGALSLGLTDADVQGKSNSDIVRLAVQKNLGDAYVKDRGDDYIRAGFDLIRSHAAQLLQNQAAPARQGDPIRDHLSQGFPVAAGNPAAATAAAHQQMCDRIQNAWKGPVPRQ